VRPEPWRPPADYAQQSGKAGEEIGIGLIELAGVRAIDFQYAKEDLAVSTFFYQHIDARLTPCSASILDVRKRVSASRCFKITVAPVW